MKTVMTQALMAWKGLDCMVSLEGGGRGVSRRRTKEKSPGAVPELLGGVRTRDSLKLARLRGRGWLNGVGGPGGLRGRGGHDGHGRRGGPDGGELDLRLWSENVDVRLAQLGCARGTDRVETAGPGPQAGAVGSLPGARAGYMRLVERIHLPVVERFDGAL